ncbi:hypothetical protein Vadar_014239 [Vaccinium darrowii]|uniref:Uncharacterized protein n=1 Tax=Vaccinium darrowii TaxID=229202 RepID=A0ACB7XZE4_9ERIC|nr:hypothetical protein Vadar_014239 [Vaccinium darrowii]
MKPEKEPSPSRLGYNPVQTTTVDSTIKFPTIITRKAPHLEHKVDIAKLRDLVYLFLLLVVLSGALCLAIWANIAIWASLLPYGPEIHVHAVSFSLHNISSAHVTTKGEITFNVTNPPDCAVPLYGDFVVSIFYGQEPLSTTIMEPFTQMEMNHTMAKALFPSKISPVKTWVSERIASYFLSNSSFEFLFNVKANGRLWPNNAPEDMETERSILAISISCPNVKVEIVTKTGEGTMIGEPLKCEVDARDTV